jgi:hypothetical protein
VDDHSQAVSADGSTVVGNGAPAGSLLAIGGFAPLLFRWTRQEGYVSLPTLGNEQKVLPEDVMPDGSIVVGTTKTWEDGKYVPGSDRAFVWDEQHGTRDLHQVLITEHGFDAAQLPELSRASGLSADATTIAATSGDTGWVIYLDRPLDSSLRAGDADQDLDLTSWTWFRYSMYTGLLQADGEGHYDADDLILEQGT